MFIDYLINNYSFMINVVLFFLTLGFFLKNPSLQKLFVSFIIYITFHNIYGITSFFHSNPKLYIIIHIGHENPNFIMTFDKKKIYLILLTWILIFKIYIVYRLYKHDKFLSLIGLLKQKILYLLALIYSVIGTILFFSYVDYPSIYTLKFIFVKCIIISSFILLYLIYKLNLDDIKNKNTWIKFNKIFYILLYFSLLFIIVEFLIYNINLRNTADAVSFADFGHVMRPAGSFMNPNNCAVFLLMTLFLVLFKNFKHLKIEKKDFLAIILISLCFYLIASRSIFIITQIMFIIIFSLFLFKKQFRLCLFTLKNLFIFQMPFFILPIFNILDKINLPILSALKILSERWYDTFGLLENLLLVYLNKILLILNYYLNFNSELFETKILTPIQSISGRLNSYSTDTTLNLILNTEGVFN